MSYTVEDYRLDLERITADKEIPPCATCSDKVIGRCMETGKQCRQFYLFIEEGDGTKFNYKVYHREYYRKNREKLLGKARKKRGSIRRYTTKLITMPLVVKQQVLAELQEIEKNFHEYVQNGESATACRLLNRLCELCNYVKQG